ncbi:MAG: fatty acid hydroxylase family protein [Myxococcales bacterium]|nr:fatty acid hydroxylase family protein [Myxococcales bacterium]
MENLWRLLIESCSDFTLYALGPTVAVNVAYLVGSVCSLALDRLPSLRRYKIQQRSNDRAALWRCVRHVVLNKFLAEIPMTVAAYPIFLWLGVRKDLPLPGLGTVVATLVASFVIEDAWHYFAHRSLHTRWGWKHIHFMHHHYTTPFGVAANYAHPLETLWTGFGTVLPVLLFRPHLATMLLWIIVRQLQAISVHVGYDFPWRPSRFLPFLGGARFHDRHHRRFNRNYAPTFVWIDRLLGTADEENLGPQAAGAAEVPVVVE